MTKPRPLPPLEELKEAFDYDPETGILRRKKSGKIVGTLDDQGYLLVQHRGTRYKNHRIAYFLHHGIDPGSLHIDHINRIRDDNRAVNLRLVTPKENHQNRANVVEVWVKMPDGALQSFSSQCEAARALGVTETAIRKRLKRSGGGPISAEKKDQRLPLSVINESGETLAFPSINQAARELEITRSRLQKRFRKYGNPLRLSDLASTP